MNSCNSKIQELTIRLGCMHVQEKLCMVRSQYAQSCDACDRAATIGALQHAILWRALCFPELYIVSGEKSILVGLFPIIVPLEIFMANSRRPPFNAIRRGGLG